MIKYTVGLDWAKTKSTVCVLNEGGVRIYRGDIPCGGEGVRWLSKRMGFKPAEVLLISEVGPASISIQEACNELGIDYYAVHASHMSLIVKTKKKTDRIDAYKLAKQGYKDNLPRRVKIPTREESKRREYVYQRSKCIRHRTSLLNEIRWIYYNHVQVFRGEGNLTMSQMTSKTKRNIIINEIENETIRNVVEARFKMIDEFNESIKIVENAMQPKEEVDKARIDRLMSIPGVGPIVAHTYCAVIGNVNRFKNAREIVSFAGLDPGISQSGTRCIGLRITKEGNRYLRTVMVLAVQSILRHGKENDPLIGIYLRYRARKKIYNKVVVAIAAKLLRIMFAVDRDGVPYNSGLLERTVKSKEAA